MISVPPLTGHVNPTIGLGEELSARGHSVAWAGLPGVVDVLLPDGAQFAPLTGALAQADFEAMQERGSGLRGPEALRFLWQDFIIPYAKGTVAALRAIVEQFEPDVLVVDQQAVAGAILARQQGIGWVTSATTSAEFTDPLADLPRVDAWVRSELTRLQLELGVDECTAASGDLRFSHQLVIAFTSQALLGPAAHQAPNTCFVGPSVTARQDHTDFPWSWLEPDTPHVLVTLGTVNASAGTRFFEVAVEAVSTMPLQAVIVAPPDQVIVPRDVDNVLVRPSVPQLALLPQMDVVVCHAGHNTVCESLAEGVPLIVAPIRDDQPIVAEQVVRTGAGTRVKFGRISPPELREALARVLGDPSFADAAAVIGESFRSAGGSAAAADAIERLVGASEAR